MTLPCSTPPSATATTSPTSSRSAETATGGTSQTPTPAGVHTDTNCVYTGSAAWLAEANSLQQQGYVIAGLSQRVAECRTRPVLRKPEEGDGAGEVGVGVTEAGNSRVLGLQNCESRWCPDCWGKKSEDREKFVAYALKAARALGLAVAMQTLTAAHTTREVEKRAKELGENPVYLQDATELVELMVASWRSSIQGSRAARLNETMTAYYRAAEITVDDLTRVRKGAETGNHFHYHVLLIGESREQLTEHAGLRAGYWEAACGKHGLEVSDKGQDLRFVETEEDAAEIAAYVAKGEGMDQIATELTQASVKRGKKARRCSPEQVWRNIAMLTPGTLRTRLAAQASALEEAAAGVRWKTCSRSFTELVAQGVELEEMEQDVEEATEPSIEDKIAVCDWGKLSPLMPEIDRALESMKLMWNGKTDNGKGLDLFDVLCMVLESNGVDYTVTTADDFQQRLRDVAAQRRAENATWLDEPDDPWDPFDGDEDQDEGQQLTLTGMGHAAVAERMTAWAWGLSPMNMTV